MFFVSLHADDLGPDVYPGVIDFLTGAIAGEIVEE
jgi:hypothetical protein